MENSTTPSSNQAAVTDIQQAKRILANISWDFSIPFSMGRSGSRLFDCRKYHWYPATFIPEIPYTLIEVLSKPGATVYDPFAGIGTTVFQALMLGRQPYATDNSTVTVAMMRSMWRLFHPATDLYGLLSFLESIKSGYSASTDYSQRVGHLPVDVNKLRPWFSPATFNEIMFLIYADSLCTDEGARAANRIALSATVKAMCAQDRGWGCIADNMLPQAKQLQKDRKAIDHFVRSVGILTRDVALAKRELPVASKEFLRSIDVESRVLKADVRRSPVPDEAVDLVVTSPPYPNMSDYSTSQRLSYYLLGSDPADDLASEIGARRKRHSTTSVTKYKDEMSEALEAIARKVKTGGYACFVMPSFDQTSENDAGRRQVVQECMAQMTTRGFLMEDEYHRILPTRRRHHNQGWTSLERETIFLLRKVL